MMKNGLEIGEKSNIMRSKRKEGLCPSYAMVFIHTYI